MRERKRERKKKKTYSQGVFFSVSFIVVGFWEKKKRAQRPEEMRNNKKKVRNQNQ